MQKFPNISEEEKIQRKKLKETSKVQSYPTLHEKIFFPIKISFYQSIDGSW